MTGTKTIINNSKHTIALNTYKARFANLYNKYKVFEYCDILKEKEEVIHPDSKVAILALHKIRK